MYSDYLSTNDRALNYKFKEDGLYNPEYVEYVFVANQWHPLKVHCMRCGVLITDGGKELENHRKVKKFLKKGAYLQVMCCPDCEQLIKTKTDDDRIMAQIRAGLTREAEIIGRPEEFVKQRANVYAQMEFEDEEG